MNTFKPFLLFESRRFLCKRNLILLMLLLFFLLYFVQTGVDQYEATLKNNEEFQKIEKLKVEMYINYTQYGGLGFRRLFAPSPISVFFANTGIISNMTAFLTASGPRLEIFNSLKGKNGFVVKRFGFTDFSGIILYLGSLLALLFGFESFSHKEYLKFLSSISNYRKVFFYITMSRVILLVITFLTLMGLSLLVLALNQVVLSANDYSQFASFCVITLLMVIVFFLLGTITSTMKSRVAGLMTMATIWFVLVFFIPAAIHAIIAGKAEVITPIYKLELEKFRQAFNFEQRAFKQEGKDKKKEEMPQREKDLIENYWNNEYKKNDDLEIEMRDQMEQNISFYRGLSIFFPSTLYFSAANEISSKGYINLIDFYQSSQKLKNEFTRYYIEQVYYYSNYSKVVPFLKGERENENMYYAQSRRPENFALGIAILLLYMGLLTGFSFKRYKRSVFGFTDDWQSGLKNPRLQLDKGELRPFYVEDHRFSHQVYNLLSGQNIPFKEHGFEDKIYIEDQDIVLHQASEEFLYLCRLRSMPGDIRAGSLVKLVTSILGPRMRAKGESGKIALSSRLKGGKLPYANKQISQLERQEREELLLSLMRHQTQSIYLIDDIGKGLSINFILRLKKQMEVLCREGALTIYLTSDYHPPVKTLRREETFFNHTTWKSVVGSLEGIAGDADDEEKEKEQIEPEKGE
ncbi:MAG: ABC transporter permease subunit [bacterium]|nr:ABC transporter permease subunit [bacterium]